MIAGALLSLAGWLLAAEQERSEAVSKRAWTSFSVLRGFHAGCTDPGASVSQACHAAIDGFCRDAGYATGFGALQLQGTERIEVACVSSGAVRALRADYPVLESLHSGCTDGRVGVGREC